MDYERWAHLYDDLVRDEEDVPFFVDLARRVRGAAVAELMAGTGRVARHLATAGALLTCVDRSPEMLAVLRRRLADSGLAATIVEQDVSALDLATRFALILIAFNSFEELVADDARERTLTSIRRHLAPGGRAVITLHNPAADVEDSRPGARAWTNSFVQRSTGRRIVFRHEARRRDRVWSGTQSFAYEDSGEVIATVPVHFRMSDRTEFAALVAGAGLEVEALYGDYRRGPFVEHESPRMIWSLRRAQDSG